MLKAIWVFGPVLLLGGLMPGQETEPVSVNEFVMAESLVKQVPAIYPPLARSIGVQDTVVLTVHIGKDGTVLDTSVISGHPLLISAAREAVAQWHYKPVQIAGKPVEAITVVTVPFNLAVAAGS